MPRKPEISKDIFDDLFAKSENLQKKQSTDKEKLVDVKEKGAEKKVDLFNDDLFDDIDDIFSSNIVQSKHRKVEKANENLFEESDDLFANIAVAKTSVTNEIKTNSNKTNNKSIFDSDDDLFEEKPVVTTKKEGISIAATANDTKVGIKDSSLFDSDDNNDIFFVEPKTDSKKKHDGTATITEHKSDDHNFDQKNLLKDDLDDDLFTNSKEKVTTETPKLANQLNPSDERKPVMSSHLVNDNDELFTSTFNASNKTFTRDHEIEDHVKIYTESAKDDIIKTQDIKDSLKEEIFIYKNFEKKNESKDIFKDDEDYIDPKEQNKSFENSKLKQSKLEDIFSDIMGDSDDDDIFSKHKDIPKVKDTSKTNVEDSPKIQDIFKEESKNDLFKSNKLITDIEKNVPTVKPTISQKPIPNTVETKDGPKPDTKHEPTDADQNMVTSEINKNTTEKNCNSYENISNSAVDDKLDNMKNVDGNKNLTLVANVLPDDNKCNTDTPPVLDTNKSYFDDIFNSVEASKSKPNLFTDIFNDQPPIFEKPKEHKKSQNINALFDDDSDDEALFFKKNDVILHDHPDEFSPGVSGDRFDIFHDEPPVIDVEFTHETDTNEEVVAKQSVEVDFEPKTVEDNTTGKENLFEDRQSNVEGEKYTKNIDNIKSIVHEQIKVEPVETEKQVVPKPNEEITTVDKTDGVQNEPKKIGKLKPMNFNINVTTLLPGASPKRVQKIDHTDEQAVSTQDNKVSQTNEVSEQDGPKLVRAVSFENEPDNKMLDNKLSKDRVKIQVKRRPSTRRARREAVKKSGIDFGEDSTDNSSSIDDHVKDAKTETEEQNDVTTSAKSVVGEQNTSENIDSNVTDITTPKDTPVSKDTATQKDTGSSLEYVISSPTTDVKSKVVYILSDEDIFNSKPEVSPNAPNISQVNHIKVTESVSAKTNPDKITVSTDVTDASDSKATKTKQILNIVDDDDDDIFKTMVTKTVAKKLTQPEAVKNVGKARTALNSESDDDIFKDFANPKKIETTPNESKPTTTKTEQRTIFDDLSDDDELFNKNKKQHKHSNNKKLFGSDSDEELFSGKKKEKEKEIVVEKKIEVKHSLFSDDEDKGLFSAKEKKNTGEFDSKRTFFIFISLRDLKTIILLGCSD